MEGGQKNSGGDTDGKISPVDPGESRTPCRGKDKPGFDFGKLLLGLLVISFGLYLLGKNTGYIAQDIYINILQFWPVLVIAFGLSFLDTRRPFFFLVALLIFVAVAAVIGMAVSDQLYEDHADEQRRNQPIDIEREREAELARLNIRADLADLDMGSGTDKLVEGNFHSGYAQLEKSSRLSDRVQEVQLGTENPDGWNPLLDSRGSDMDLKLGANLPIELNLDINATDADIDLREIAISSVSLDADASDAEILLSDKVDQLKVEARSNAGRIRIVLPQSLGAKVILNSSASSESLPGFERVSDIEYRSGGYDSASRKAEINVTINASDLRIERI